jgi:lipopolysaccharide transport system permease protein
LPGRSAEISVAVPVLVVQRTLGWGRLGLAELWRYRELLWFWTSREIKGRYRQMALGPLWVVIKPLLDMVVFTLIFGGLAKLDSEGVPYPLFTYTAILPWTYFSVAAAGSTTSLVTKMGVISKVYFPRLVVPISAVLGSLVDLAVSFVVLLGMLVAYGVPLQPRMLFLPLYVAFAMATALTIGLWSATLAVRFRDLQFVVNYALQLAMYVTPVAYSAALVPQRWQTLYRLNPMFWVVEGFRWALLAKGTAPEPFLLVPVGAVAVLLVAGAFVFRRLERTVVDLL